jgi:predicted GNAT superfamily acetyltransferase
MNTPARVRLRDLTTLADFARVVALEKAIWGLLDGDDVTPVSLLTATVRRGAILIGAFAPLELDGRPPSGVQASESGRTDDEMIGFVYSVPAIHSGRLSHWSHMLGVTAGHRRGGTARALKLAQRDRAMTMGVDLIEWTFDPLQAVNAHFNFATLGVVSEEYEENVYGMSPSPLHGRLATDRLIAQWWLRTPRVEGRITGRADVDLSGLAAANTIDFSGDWPVCRAVDSGLERDAVTVVIPVGFTAMLAEAADVARAWRGATREIFRTYFARGYRAVDFELDRGGRYGRYVLARDRDASFI